MSDQGEALYLTIPQLAKRLDCSHSTLYGQIAAGTFPYPIIHVGRDKRVPLEAVLLAESGVATELGALRAEIAALREELAADRRARRTLALALADSFVADGAGVVPAPPVPTTSIPPCGAGGEKYREEDGWHGPMGGRAARSAVGQGGDRRRAAPHRGLRGPSRLPGAGRDQGDGAPLPAARNAPPPQGGASSADASQ